MKISNSDRVLELLRQNPGGLDDDEISEKGQIRPRQQVNQICRRLAAEGFISRESIFRGGRQKIVNRLKATPNRNQIDVSSNGTSSTDTPLIPQLPTLPRSAGKDSAVPTAGWRRRLAALVAATGKSEEDLLDEALQTLALKVLREEVGSSPQSPME